MSIQEHRLCDASTTVQTLRERVELFVSQREWHQFHSPKNLSMSLAIEAAELMEHFQWITTDQSRRIVGDSEKLKKVSDEIADVMCYLLALANELQIDLSIAVSEKMSRNEQRYPVEEFRGRYGKEDLRPERP